MSYAVNHVAMSAFAWSSTKLTWTSSACMSVHACVSSAWIDRNTAGVTCAPCAKRDWNEIFAAIVRASTGPPGATRRANARLPIACASCCAGASGARARAVRSPRSSSRSLANRS